MITGFKDVLQDLSLLSKMLTINPSLYIPSLKDAKGTNLEKNTCLPLTAGP